MLAGLIFAVQDADDRPGTLAATLPFAGMTVIEYQARLLAAAGASQIVIVVARLTPELLGAVARIGRRGVTVDTVRSAAEAGARIHPLSRLLVLSDGLVTTDAVLGPILQERSDILLVVPEQDSTLGYELIGGGDAWAGVAQLDGKLLADVAAMPRDYDVQSALLLAAVQSGSLRLMLPEGERREGHGIERRSDALESRSLSVVSATLAARSGWFDRWVVRPLARLALPPLIRRHVPTTALVGVSGALGLAGLGCLFAEKLTAGLLIALVGMGIGALASSFAWLRDEIGLGRVINGLTAAIPGLAALLLGRAADAERAELAGSIIAISFVVIAALAERASTADRPTWTGGPPGYLVVLAAFTIIGFPVAGLTVAAIYAAITLTLAIEKLRSRV